jgi:hypothetical protein
VKKGGSYKQSTSGATNRQHDDIQPKTKMKLKHNNLQTAMKQGSKGAHKQHPNT